MPQNLLSRELTPPVVMLVTSYTTVAMYKYYLFIIILSKATVHICLIHQCASAHPCPSCSMLRVEFDQRGHSYYSALDAVMLVGSTHSASSGFMALGETITTQVMKMGLHKSM